MSDLAAWVGREIPDADPRAGAVLSHASNLIRSYVSPVTWEPDEVPEIVRDVTVRVAARAYFNPEELDSFGIDDGTKRWGNVRGLVLTNADCANLDQFRTEPRRVVGMGVVSTYRGDDWDDGTRYVPTGPPPSGYPFPWYASEDF